MLYHSMLYHIRLYQIILHYVISYCIIRYRRRLSSRSMPSCRRSRIARILASFFTRSRLAGVYFNVEIRNLQHIVLHSKKLTNTTAPNKTFKSNMRCYLSLFARSRLAISQHIVLFVCILISKWTTCNMSCVAYWCFNDEIEVCVVISRSPRARAWRYRNTLCCLFVCPRWHKQLATCCLFIMDYFNVDMHTRFACIVCIPLLFARSRLAMSHAFPRAAIWITSAVCEVWVPKGKLLAGPIATRITSTGHLYFSHGDHRAHYEEVWNPWATYIHIMFWPIRTYYIYIYIYI